MQDRSWNFRAPGSLTALCKLLPGLLLPVLTAASAPPATSVTVAVTNLRSTEGVVLACITTETRGFPQCRDGDGSSQRLSLPARAELTLRFDNVAPGTYAIALLHDENENGRADRVLGMMPREGFGFSRDAPVRMGPPDFEDAAFEVGQTPVRQTIRMRYML